MIDKKESKFKSLNRTLLLLALSLLTVSLYFLFSDHVENYFYTNTVQKSADNIGEIVTYENDIRVKQQKSIQWRKVNKIVSLQSGDGIFTGPNSETKVRLSSGDIIDVQQNTMVVFAKTRGKQLANLLQGTFKLSVQKSLKIKIQGKETEIKAENSQVEITIDKDNAPTVKVLEGKAEITDNEKKIEIAENQTVELEKPTAEELAQSPIEEKITLLPPEPHLWRSKQIRQLVLRGDEKIVLPYEKKNNLNQVLLEFSKDISFKNSSVRSEWHDNNGSVVTSITDPGIYFLRLQSVDEESKLISVSETMSVSIDRPALPLAPVPTQAKVILQQEEKTKLEWAPGANAIRYQVTTLDTQGEKKIFITDQRSFEWTAEELGEQFVTLKSIDAYDRLSDNTERIKITVESKPLTQDRSIALSDSEIRYEVENISSYKNRSYAKSFVEMEAATATIFSKEELTSGGGGALTTLLGVRVRHWVDFNRGYEGYFRSKVVSVNSENGTPAPMEAEGRVNLRTTTDFNPFSSLRKSQFKFFGGLHYYKNNGGSTYSPQYQMGKVGGGFLFPIGSQFETSGEASVGIGLDQSKRYEASGLFLWYLANDYSTGLGYRVYLFEAGGASSAPRGLPYREGAVEILYLLRYRY